MFDNLQKPSERGRAWVEVDLDALAHNVSELRSRLPSGCELMAIVKANAYGLGAGRVAARLRREGVRSFAVATVTEGVQLREGGLEGDILVLGRTLPGDAGFLSANGLSQLVADGAHASALDSTGYKLRVHIAVDTGMHRLGIEPSNLAEIEGVFACKNLAVEGVATHFASSDSLDEGDMEFTNLQNERFCAVVGALKGKGYEVGRLHSQASYGVYNFPGFKCDYARAGIALYGVMSHDGDTVVVPALKPVVSLRAVVAQVRWIGPGEGVSYGRTFTTGGPMRLATIGAGYADGVPRHMSGNGGSCIINGRRAPIVGRICMDLLMADVTGLDAVAAGDVATLIGKDGGEEIRCEDFAAASGTISNEILSRLSSRLPRIYIGS